MKRILDKSFKYVPAARTNVAATFARIRREQKAAAKRDERPANVSSLNERLMKALG